MFATCVSTEKCEFMKMNTAVWGDVDCCSTDFCNDPDAGTCFFQCLDCFVLNFDKSRQFLSMQFCELVHCYVVWRPLG